MEQISLCRKDCQECGEDAARYEELIKKLSEMHSQHEIDPERLCSATFREFDSSHPEFHLFSQMQGELFEIANRHQLAWAKI